MAKKTSELILEIASKLFSQKGFSGTSIREIASKAKVNISAISYHFESKENLLFQVFLQSHKKFEQILAEISTELSVADFAYELYKKFKQHHINSLNTFRILLTPNVKIPKNISLPLLPPGGNSLFNVITKEIGSKVPEAKRYWLTCLISHEVFFSTLFSKLPMLKNSLKNYQKLTEMTPKEEIYNFVEMILFKYKKLKKIQNKS